MLCDAVYKSLDGRKEQYFKNDFLFSSFLPWNERLLIVKSSPGKPWQEDLSEESLEKGLNLIIKK